MQDWERFGEEIRRTVQDAGLVALSGALLAQYQGSSDVQMGRGSHYRVLFCVRNSKI